MALVSLSDAKTHLRITTTAQDADITAKLEAAEAVILDYLKVAWVDETWTRETVPLVVKAAILLMATHLYEHRGDDPMTDDKLWEAITRLLMRRRDPALA